MRWLDYGQRLRHQKRNAYCFKGSEEGGEIALKQSILHGRSATGYSVQPLSVGEPFDAVVYDASQPLLSASQSHRLSYHRLHCRHFKHFGNCMLTVGGISSIDDTYDKRNSAVILSRLSQTSETKDDKRSKIWL